jgi:hypothetical protein
VPESVLAEARGAGARLVVFGKIHKVSTLIQSARVHVLDIRQDKIVLVRRLSFRGDDARAWQRAEAFLATDLQHGARFEMDREAQQ